MELSGVLNRAFLVRDSTTVPNSFVLTMFAKGVSKNFQIMLVSVSLSLVSVQLARYSSLSVQVDNPGGTAMYRIDDGPTFPRIDQLLRHYATNPDRLPCRLTDYCPRPPTRMTEC